MARARTIEEYYIEREAAATQESRVRSAGIPSEYWNSTWDDYDDTAWVDDESLKDILLDYASTWEPSDRHSLVLLGDPGYGKTFGMSLLAMELIRKGCWVRWISYAGLMEKKLELIRLSKEAQDMDDWGEHEKVEMKLRWITSDCQALFLDDLGKEHRTSTGFSDNTLDHLLRSRQAAGKLTFVSSNYSNAEFATYNPSMASFLGQMAEVCELTEGKDYREDLVPPKRQVRRAGR